MSHYFLSVVAMLVVGLPAFGLANSISIGDEEVVRIEISHDGDDDLVVGNQVEHHRKQNKRLRARIRRLEQAVAQLQAQVFHLRPTSVQVAVTEFTCYINTPFNGTAYGKGGSKAEATAKALSACEAKGGGMACSDRHVRCGS